MGSFFPFFPPSVSSCEGRVVSSETRRGAGGPLPSPSLPTFRARLAHAGKVEAGEGTRFIVSSHDFEGTPATAELERHVARCRALAAAAPAPLVVKLVTTASPASAAVRVLGVVRRAASSGQPMIGLAMGEAGVPARLLAGVAGGVLTFATLDDGAASAPGQPSLRHLLTRFRLHGQTPSATRVYGVVGDPVSHSKGPLLHNALLQAHHQDAVYVPFLVRDFPRFLREARASGLDLAGLSVTIPHKVPPPPGGREWMGAWVCTAGRAAQGGEEGGRHVCAAMCRVPRRRSLVFLVAQLCGVWLRSHGSPHSSAPLPTPTS